MASNTTRFGLLKKDPVADKNDTFNIQTMLNDNWDKLDSAAKKSELDAHANDTTVHITAAERTTWNNKAEKSVATQTADGLMSKADKAKLDGIEAGAQKNTVNSVNNKTGDVTLSAADVGAETPGGAQEKADAALNEAKTYLDSQKGQPGGVATLGEDGKVPAEQLSSDAATKDELTHLNLNVIDMAVELETLKGATLNGVTANIFIETFQDLNDINLTNGIYDSTNKRLVL